VQLGGGCVEIVDEQPDRAPGETVLLVRRRDGEGVAARRLEQLWVPMNTIPRISMGLL